MIVDPDFLEHWKTRMLIDMLEDECAPLYVIRLWGHCQNRREWVFDGMPVHATKAICRYQGDAEKLEEALIACGFLERKANEITVVGWDEHNASLIANWRNGSRGGRPKKNQQESDEKPMGLPTDNPNETDKIGLDRIGLDKTDKSSLPGVPQAASEPSLIDLPTNRYKSQGEVYRVPQSKHDEWEELYPAVDIMAELRKMKGWLTENAQKRKTKRGMGRFIASWLGREQDRGGYAKGKRDSQGDSGEPIDGAGWAEGFDPLQDPADYLINGDGSDSS